MHYVRNQLAVFSRSKHRDPLVDTVRITKGVLDIPRVESRENIE